MFPDQLRADFVGCYGASFARTPAIDALASESVLYERALSMHPVCVPARAALLTGCNALTTGIVDNTHWLRPDHGDCGMPSWPALLSAAGYHTEAIGKMHFIPWDISEGFDHRVISEDKRHVHIQDDYGAYLASHGLRKLRGWEEEGYVDNRMAAVGAIPAEHQVDAWVGRRAVDFLNSYDGDKPFACMVAFPGPHDPYNPPREYAEMFDPVDMPDPIPGTPDSERFRDDHIRAHAGGSAGVDLADFPLAVKRRIRAHYCGLITLIDEQVNAILAALDARPDGRDTIVIFAADHGDFVGDFDFLGKNLFFDPAMHVPLIVRVPGGPRGVRASELVTITDIFATILAAAGAPATTAKGFLPAARGRARRAAPQPCPRRGGERHLPRRRPLSLVALRQRPWYALRPRGGCGRTAQPHRRTVSAGRARQARCAAGERSDEGDTGGARGQALSLSDHDARPSGAPAGVGATVSVAARSRAGGVSMGDGVVQGSMFRVGIGPC